MTQDCLTCSVITILQLYRVDRKNFQDYKVFILIKKQNAIRLCTKRFNNQKMVILKKNLISFFFYFSRVAASYPLFRLDFIRKLIKFQFNNNIVLIILFFLLFILFFFFAKTISIILLNLYICTKLFDDQQHDLWYMIDNQTIILLSIHCYLLKHL